MSASPGPGLGGREYLAVALIVLIWGSNFVAMKMGLLGFTPMQLGAARFLFGALPLLLFVAAPRVRWRWVWAYGLIQGIGQFGLLFYSLSLGMTATLASVLMQTQVFFTALFSLLVLGERPGRALVIGMALAGAGLACLYLHYIDAGVASSAVGLVLCVAAAAMWAASNIIVRLAQRESPGFDVLAFVVWCSAVPVLPFVLLSFALDAPHTRLAWLAAPWQSWAAVVYIGWGASVVAYTLWNGLIRRHGANRIAPFSLGMPAVGLAAGMLLLGERVSVWQWVGIVLTLAALVAVVVGAMAAGRHMRP